MRNKKEMKKTIENRMEEMAKEFAEKWGNIDSVTCYEDELEIVNDFNKALSRTIKDTKKEMIGEIRDRMYDVDSVFDEWDGVGFDCVGMEDLLDSLLTKNK